LTHALIVLGPFVDAISNSTDIPDDDGLGLTCHRNINNGSADLVFYIPQPTCMLGFHPHPGPHQAFVPSGAFAGATDGLSKRAKPFVMALPGMPLCPAGDEGGFRGIAHNSGMHFAQIDTDHVVSWGLVRLLPIFNHDMPGIAPGFPVVDQADFQDTQYIGQMRRQGGGDRLIAFPIGQREDHTSFF
jgi:hypothetical protein